MIPMPDEAPVGEPDEDETHGCGYSYDHDVRELEEVDGIRTHECRHCGAEWSEEGDGD